MIISMKLRATREEIDEVCEQVKQFGYKVHSIEGEERVVIGVVGVGDVTSCMESIEAMPQVDNVVRISAPYKFVSREFRKEKTRIKVNGSEIGGDEFVVMAGPCSVESEKQIMQAAGIPTESTGLARIPKDTVEVTGEDARRVLKMMELLDDHDDVQNVSANFNIPDEAMAELEG